MKTRRKDDERIATMLVLIKQVHDAMFGKNNIGGMKSEFDIFKGGFAVWKWIAGSGGIIAGLLLILQIIKFLRG